MNKVIFIGRMVRENKVNYTQGEKPLCVCRNTIALDRGAKEGTQSADFVPIVAFGHNGEFAEKYVKKGMKMAIEGHMQSGSYQNKEGNTIYTLECVVDNWEFADSKGSSINATDTSSADTDTINWDAV